MTQKRITIHDIAKQLNTTASTVSRALQDHPRISQPMKEAVRELATKLNYQPNYRALSLRKGFGNTIGVLVPQVNRNFFATVIHGIEEIAVASGYHVLICQSYESLTKEEMQLNNLLNGRIDGLIASVSLETKSYPHFESFVATGLPLVFFDRVPDSMEVSKITIDDYTSAYKITEHLIANGCKRIALFGGPEHINVYRNRSAGYRDALKNNKLPVFKELHHANAITRETGYQAMAELISNDVAFDAVFAAGDYGALGAILYAREKKIDIPGHFAITGYANEPFGEIIDPPLTSVDQHGIEMGKQSARMLIEEIEYKGKSFIPREIVLKSEIIYRDSSQRIG